jgi:3-hydroxybutyryl-CoA dehydratase
MGDELVDAVWSQGRSLTEADLLIWAGLVHDFTPLHFDKQMMSESLFGEPIAHGFIAMVWASGLMFPDMASWYAPDHGDHTAEWQDVRFHAPVRVGDTLRCKRTVRDDAQGRSFWVEMINQDGTVVMSGLERLAQTADGSPVPPPDIAIVRYNEEA